MLRPRIMMVGGGSYAWCPCLIRDTLVMDGLGNAEFRLFDMDIQAASDVASVAERYNETLGTQASFFPSSDPVQAFDGSDFVIITISTGGLDAMAHDIKIPERYGIYATVGDTVGPGGWARGLRNIPVFVKLAEHLKRHLGLKGTRMARAQCHTLRLKLLKIGAQVRITARRIWVSMAGGCPYADLLATVLARLGQSPPLRC